MKKKFLLSVLICILIPIFLISGCSTKEAPDAGEQIITNEESKGENGSAISPSPTGTSDVAPNDDTIQPQPSAEKVPFDLSALSNESHGWGFVKKKGERPPGGTPPSGGLFCCFCPELRENLGRFLQSNGGKRYLACSLLTCRASVSAWSAAPITGRKAGKRV